METEEKFTFRITELNDIPSLYSVRSSTRQNSISTEKLLEYGITPESIANGFTSNEFYGMVCEANGSIVGFCTGNTITGEIIVLAILPEYEGKRIGITLLTGVISELMKMNLTSIWLGCSPDPASRSYGFYRANGWIENGKKLENGDDILVLANNDSSFELNKAMKRLPT